MRDRHLGSLGVLAAVIAVQLGLAVPVAAQTPTKSSEAPLIKSWMPSRPPDGHPDLQGIWRYATITPLQRPDELAEKQFLTAAEAAALEERTIRNRVDRPPRPGDPGAYNQFWIDYGNTVVGTRQTSLIVDPPDGKLPPLTPEATKRAAAEAESRNHPSGPEDLDQVTRCILGFNAGPPMLPGPYNNHVQLFQVPGSLAIVNEMNHAARIVPTDGRPHGKIRQWSGDSRGRWDKDTLIIDTIHFTNGGTGNFLRPATDEQLHVTERFTRVAADTLLYEFTIDDRTVWTRPWSASLTMTRMSELIYEYGCHEGNYALRNILSGARAQEKAADETRSKK